MGSQQSCWIIYLICDANKCFFFDLQISNSVMHVLCGSEAAKRLRRLVLEELSKTGHKTILLWLGFQIFCGKFCHKFMRTYYIELRLYIFSYIGRYRCLDIQYPWSIPKKSMIDPVKFSSSIQKKIHGRSRKNVMVDPENISWLILEKFHGRSRKNR